jgi:hypothetical protein
MALAAADVTYTACFIVCEFFEQLSIVRLFALYIDIHHMHNLLLLLLWLFYLDDGKKVFLIIT